MRRKRNQWRWVFLATATHNRRRWGFANPPDPAHRGRGFTLLEVLLALGLCVLLGAAVYAALQMHYRYSIAGREEMERAQITRAVFQKIEADIKSVVYREPQAAAEDGSDLEAAEETGSGGSPVGTGSTASGGSTSSSGDVTAGMVTDPDAAYTQASQGLVGNQYVLTLSISRPSRDMKYASFVGAGGLGTRTSDLRTVQWFVGAADGSATTSRVGAPAGLSRLEGDRMAMMFAEEQAATELLMQQAELLTPRIVHLEFAYFDGTVWQVEWDSQVLGMLPQAVRVTIGYAAPEELDPGVRQTTAPVELFHYVVALPLADPATTIPLQ